MTGEENGGKKAGKHRGLGNRLKRKVMAETLSSVHRDRRKARVECVTKPKVGEDAEEQNE